MASAAKRHFRQNGVVALEAENPDYPTLYNNEGNELVVWCVVIGKFERFL